MKALKFCLVFAICLFASDLDIKPLSGSEFRSVFKEYLSKDSGDFDNYEFEKDFKMHEIYCQKGLVDACEVLGVSYVLGLGTQQDIKKGINLIDFALKNTSDEIFKEQYAYTLNLAKQIQSSGDDAIRKVISTFSKNSSECQSRSGDKDACFKATILTGLLPTDMLGISDQSGFFEMLFDNDVAINGAKNSKISKMLKAYEDILK